MPHALADQLLDKARFLICGGTSLQDIVRTAVSHDGLVLVFAPETMRDHVPCLRSLSSPSVELQGGGGGSRGGTEWPCFGVREPQAAVQMRDRPGSIGAEPAGHRARAAEHQAISAWDPVTVPGMTSG